MGNSNVWKLQDAKARFSDVVRRARAGEPQQVTVRGEQAVLIVDPERFEVHPKQPKPRTMAEFVARMTTHRGVTEGVNFESERRMAFKKRRPLFEA